ncbi:MAG: cupredoxin domain-containing protein [Alphaproteobacteria bacterium]|nr:cupredoxin domain-containing protein [Alphaproteobacteria bacterium]
MKKTIALLAVLGLFLMTSLPAAAAEEFTITIKDHRFTPETLEIPAGQKVKLVILNQDPTPEEFESYELNREKIIGGNSKGIIFVGPLKPGTYPYFGEFNMETAKGQIIAK